ncbi:PDGLE domain-containing protein [Nocardioides rubriscoriae]|uniref:PDGLE domain-containing protein n=1 Tax=Nocardioides rubriscoriae TaxID=642762 RepID=UPI001B871605|nr:PDGLE domain-containing protein [Nocardioides rubriscoriae]
MKNLSTRVSNRAVALGILVVALLLAGVVSYYAASAPDGLTKVAQDQGFADTQTDHATDDGPFAGYGASFVDDDRLSGGLAGVVGVVVVLGLAGGLTMVLRRRTPEDADV